jgi:hypothetical protein
MALALLAPSVALADEIVVTGKPLKDTAADLKACLERKCPPDEDVKATLAHAENQFVAGDYAGSRRTLQASIGRNRRYGERYPVPVSDLFRANGRIAEHMGEAKNFQLSVLDMRDTLKDGLGENDFRVLVAQIEVADSRAKLGFPDEAMRMYKDIEEKSLGLGKNRVATLARIRQALIMKVRYDDTPDEGLKRDLLEKLDQVIARPLAGAEEFALAAEVIRAKVDRKEGSSGSTEALIKRFAEQGGVSRPLLIYSEPLERIDLSGKSAEGIPDPNTLTRLTALSAVGQWADIGFWIGADGHVSDVEVLRSQGAQYWVKPVAENIRKRLYAPLKKDGDAAPGFYMIERYTQTARFESDSTGSRIRRREATPRIERIDITPDNYDQPSRQAQAGT